MKKIEELEQQLNEIKAELEKHKQARFEVGKWSIIKKQENNIRQPKDALINYQGYNTVAFGFDHNGCWTNDYGEPYEWNDKTIRATIATETEIKEALIKEAERIGFKEGIRFKTIDGSDRICTVIKYDAIYYSLEDDSLHPYILNSEWNKNGNYISSNPPIYKQGQWAEIITEPVIKIGDYEVKFNNNKTISLIDKSHFLSDDIIISKETIQTILDRMKQWKQY